MMKRKANEKGFTLIEVIVTLILVGITAALAGIWIVSVANGYIFARTNASVSQKAQLALNRLTKEFSAIQTVNIANTNGTQITYTRTRVTGGTPGTVSVVLSWGGISGNPLQLNVAGAGAQTLTDSVSSFALAYCDSPNSASCPATWSATSRIIEITLTLTAGNNTPVTFTRRVTPRNI